MNDPPPLSLDHPWGEQTREQVAARQVELQDFVPDFVRGIHQILRLITAGIVDQHIDAAEFCQHILRQLPHLIALGHVGHKVLDFDIRSVGNLGLRPFELVFMPSADGNVGPRFRKGASHRLADAFAAPRNESGAAGEREEFIEHGAS